MFEAMLTSFIGAYGQIGLFIVMIIQTIIAPISSEALLIFASVIGIQLFDIVLFGGSGLVAGAVIAFYIGRLGGKPIIDKLLGRKWTARVDNWVSEHGTKAILITRLLPFIPFDLISYISGVTSLKARNYFIATALGAFPRTLLLALMGIGAKGFLLWLGIGLELAIFIGIVGFVVIIYMDRKGYIDILERGIIAKVVKNIFKNKKRSRE